MKQVYDHKQGSNISEGLLLFSFLLLCCGVSLR